MTAHYEADIVAWASEQAQLIRSGRFDLLDTEHIAEEIEDVGKSEQRELASRMAVLLCHLIKWCYQPARQGASWLATIKTQRERVQRRLRQTPSLGQCLHDADWLADAWDDARDAAAKESGLAYEKFPEQCPWPMEDVLSPDWLPLLPELR